MTNFEIDLKTKIVSTDTKVYMARAGKRGHLFNQVLSSKAIGPDLPNLQLDLSEDFKDGSNLTAKIGRARKLASWLRTSEKRRGDKPSASLSDHKIKRSGHAQIEGIVRTYFTEMKAGDVLVIPNPQIFGEAILAEVLPIGRAPQAIPGIKRFEGFVFQGRKFGHVKMVRMMDLPRSINEIARAPTGLARINDFRVKNRIFEMLYTDYVLDDVFSSQIITTKPEFRPFDATVLNAFLRMVDQNVTLLQEEGEDARLRSLSYAAFYMAESDGPSVKININSPGHLAIIDKSIVPLVAGTLLGVLVAAGFDSSTIAQDTVSINVVNTRSQTDLALDLCSRDVGKLTQSMLRFLPENDFQEMCRLLAESHEKTGAKSNISVEKKND